MLNRLWNYVNDKGQDQVNTFKVYNNYTYNTKLNNSSTSLCLSKVYSSFTWLPTRGLAPGIEDKTLVFMLNLIDITFSLAFKTKREKYDFILLKTLRLLFLFC